jgi:hypothetical protein
MRCWKCGIWKSDPQGRCIQCGASALPPKDEHGLHREAARPIDAEPPAAEGKQMASVGWRKEIVLDGDTIRQLPVNLRSLIEKAQSSSRANVQFSYRFADSSGQEQVYHSMDEMPADVRAHFEALQGLQGNPDARIPAGLRIQLDLKGIPGRKTLVLAAILATVMLAMIFAMALL